MNEVPKATRATASGNQVLDDDVTRANECAAVVARSYGCRSWTKFVPSDPRRDPRWRDECDTVPPIFTHPANAPRLTMVTPITRRRIKAAYLWAGLAGLGLGDTLGSHVVRKVQKISYLRI